jgi:hypothetical protein
MEEVNEERRKNEVEQLSVQLGPIFVFILSLAYLHGTLARNLSLSRDGVWNGKSCGIYVYFNIYSIWRFRSFIYREYVKHIHRCVRYWIIS